MGFPYKMFYSFFGHVIGHVIGHVTYYISVGMLHAASINIRLKFRAIYRIFQRRNGFKNARYYRFLYKIRVLFFLVT